MLAKIIRYHQTHAQNARGVGQTFHVEASRFLRTLDVAPPAEEAKVPSEPPTEVDLRAEHASELLLERLSVAYAAEPPADRVTLEEALLEGGLYCSIDAATMGANMAAAADGADVVSYLVLDVDLDEISVVEINTVGRRRSAIPRGIWWCRVEHYERELRTLIKALSNQDAVGMLDAAAEVLEQHRAEHPVAVAAAMKELKQHAPDQK